MRVYVARINLNGETAEGVTRPARPRIATRFCVHGRLIGNTPIEGGRAYAGMYSEATASVSLAPMSDASPCVPICMVATPECFMRGLARASRKID